MRMKPWADVEAGMRRDGASDSDVEMARKGWNAENARLAGVEADRNDAAYPPPSVPGDPRVAGNAPAPKMETGVAPTLKPGGESAIGEFARGAMTAAGRPLDWLERTAAPAVGRDVRQGAARALMSLGVG